MTFSLTSFTIFHSRLECEFDTAVELAAFSLQGKTPQVHRGFSHSLTRVLLMTHLWACPKLQNGLKCETSDRFFIIIMQ